MAKFEKGRSGNPQGRPRGARSSVTALRKELISDEDLQAIVDVVVDKAKEGDLTAAGMILDRRLPKLRVTADFGLEKEGLAEQLKAARERVAAASRPVLQVISGVSGGLTGGPDAPDDTECAPSVPGLATPAASSDIPQARDEFPNQHAPHAGEVSAGIAPAHTREEPETARLGDVQWRTRPPSPPPVDHDFDPYA